MVVQMVNHPMDLREKVCSYPTAETPVFLKKMAADELLEMLSDYDLVLPTIPSLM